MLASTSGRPARTVGGTPAPSLTLALLARRRPAGRPAPPSGPAQRGRAPTAVAAAPTSPAPAAPPPPAAASAEAPIDDFATDPRPVMLYDGVCGLCNNGVDVALRLDGGRALRFAALQSPAGRRLLARAGRSPDDLSSVVLVRADGTAFTQSDAIVEIGRTLGVFPAPLAALALALPPRGRDAAYRAVADNRYSIFGRRDVCRLTQGGVGGGGDPGRFIVE